jgi:hypothetical protein
LPTSQKDSVTEAGRASISCGSSSSFLALAGPTGNFFSWPGERATAANRCSTAARMASGSSDIDSSLFGSPVIGVILGAGPTKA